MVVVVRSGVDAAIQIPYVYADTVRARRHGIVWVARSIVVEKLDQFHAVGGDGQTDVFDVIPIVEVVRRRWSRRSMAIGTVP